MTFRIYEIFLFLVIFYENSSAFDTERAFHVKRSNRRDAVIKACETVRTKSIQCNADVSLRPFLSVVEGLEATCKYEYKKNNCALLERDSTFRSRLLTCGPQDVCQSMARVAAICTWNNLNLTSTFQQSVLDAILGMPKMAGMGLASIFENMAKSLSNSATCHENKNGEKDQMIFLFEKQIHPALVDRWNIPSKSRGNYLEMDCTRLALSLANRLREHNRELIAKTQSGEIARDNQETQKAEAFKKLQELVKEIRAKAMCMTPQFRGEVLCKGAILATDLAVSIGMAVAISSATASVLGAAVEAKIISEKTAQFFAFLWGAKIKPSLSKTHLTTAERPVTPSEPVPERLPRVHKVKEEVQHLTPELKKALASCGADFTSSICRGASGELQFMLEAKGIKTEAVRNSFHTFLRIEDGLGPGKDLFIDPTYKQFVNDVSGPDIFVGSSDELADLLRQKGISDVYMERYFDIKPDPTVPTLHD